MNEYSKGKRTIYATERAFEVLYKAQGFKKVKAKNKEKKPDNSDAKK